MKITGLLNAEEARACEAAGYQGLLACAHQRLSRPGRTDRRLAWLAYVNLDLSPIRFHYLGEPISNYLLYAPPEGAWLPMSTAPKDGRPVVVFTRSSLHPAISIAGRVTSGFWWNVVDGWMIENLSYADRHILGWRPYVKVEEG